MCIRDSNKAKEYFLSNMSHEIRTPLNAILGFVSVLQDEVVSENHKKYLEIISNSGESLLSIINDILDFSKLRSGEFTIESKPFNLHVELINTLELFVATANQKDIILDSYMDPKIPVEIVSDPLRIKQVVSNFLSNAIKFTPYKGHIKIDVSCVNNILNIVVSDTGTGISQEDQQKIFEPFSQAKDTKETTGGTGLGLSICKQLARHMGGDIHVKSAIDKGSEFSFTIPINIENYTDVVISDLLEFQDNQFAILKNLDAYSFKLDSLKYYFSTCDISIDMVNELQSDYEILFLEDSFLNQEKINYIEQKRISSIVIMDYYDERYDEYAYITPICFPIYASKLQRVLHRALELKNENHDTTTVVQQLKFKGHLLVAEDNEANQEFIKIILDRYGFSYDMVEDGEAAVDAFKKSQYDMVLMDHQMPKKSGTQAAKEILLYEIDNAQEHTPLIALSANVMMSQKEKNRRSIYDAFLGKPINLKELEQLFEKYCVVFSYDDEESILDMQKLKNEMMLEDDQLQMLLKVFISKMDHLMPELYEAIESYQLEQIAKLSHSIKGSSANFRITKIQDASSEMEEAATKEDKNYHYKVTARVIEKLYKKIKFI
jgi:CheY-like chemotaxis protein